jgi:transcriptional regulator with XRE-family HTH domain
VPTEKLTKLKILLLEDDKPQYQVAALCGIHPSTLSNYALGQHPSVAHLRALCKYFKCRQQDIIGWEEVEWEVPDEA